jgi:ubiquitin carboxyl-terminal hydrolase 4/11
MFVQMLTLVGRTPHVLKRFNNKRPKWVSPLEFLDPELQNMFDLSYFAESATIVPTGWNSTPEDRPLPRLTTRQPKAVVSDVDMQSPETADGSDESGSEGSAGAVPTAVVTRMADESSDEDSDFPKHKVRDNHWETKLGLQLTDHVCSYL